jgi:hypothetical protein
MHMTYFAENLAYIAAVTEALNKLPESKDLYVHVELRENDTHRKIGAWSDEIAGDAWYYMENAEADK